MGRSPRVWWQLLRCCVKSSKPDKASFPVRWGSVRWCDPAPDCPAYSPSGLLAAELTVRISECATVCWIKGVKYDFFNVLWFVYIALYIWLYSTIMKVSVSGGQNHMAAYYTRYHPAGIGGGGGWSRASCFSQKWAVVCKNFYIYHT